MDLRERIQWALNHIVEVKRLTNAEIAEATGVNASTINHYRRKDTEAKTSFTLAFAKVYGFNYQWLVAGEGEPFSGACSQYPEICGPREAQERPMIPEAATPYEGRTEGVTKIAEDLTIAARVLESNTVYATALHINIRSFGEALQDKERFTNIERRLDQVISDMQALQKENEELRKRLNSLGAPGPGGEPASGSGTESSVM